jgi:hypothetical protein
MKTLLIPIVITFSVVSCTPTIDRVDKHLSSTTDSALSILEDLDVTPDTIREVTVKTQTIVKTRVVEVESSPVVNAMVRPVSIEKRGCDTVWIRDTVFISR